VEIHSDGIGQGTRAVVRLPVVLSPEPQLAASAIRERGPLPRRRILVVDDNQDAADSLASVLSLMGNEVQVGNDGVEAVQLAEAFRPDVVMLDIGMPRMNGYEACAAIRQQPANADAVIIAVTGWGQEEDRRQSELAGFNLHLTKPVDPGAVETLLASLPPPRA
jgi:CheY-like chemotaxis protein